MNQPLSTLDLNATLNDWNGLVVRIQGFVASINAMFAEQNAKRNADMLAKFPDIATTDYWSALEIRGGSIRGDWLALDHRSGGSHRNGGQRSIYCFIRLTNGETKTLGMLTAGDIHKPATFKAPAKHRRGNVHAADFGKSCAGLYGIQYLK